jgi:hypothetical protein
MKEAPTSECHSLGIISLYSKRYVAVLALRIIRSELG